MVQRRAAQQRVFGDQGGVATPGARPHYVNSRYYALQRFFAESSWSAAARQMIGHWMASATRLWSLPGPALNLSHETRPSTHPLHQMKELAKLIEAGGGQLFQQLKGGCHGVKQGRAKGCPPAGSLSAPGGLMGSVQEAWDMPGPISKAKSLLREKVRPRPESTRHARAQRAMESGIPPDQRACVPLPRRLQRRRRGPSMWPPCI
jgi:hypothetical protein